MIRYLFGIFVFAAVLAVSPAWAAKLLIIESDQAPAYREGRLIESTQEILLSGDARLVLMDETGAAVTIKGPYSGVPGGATHAQGLNFLARLAAILLSVAPEEDRTVLGATRSASFMPRTRGPWDVDVTAGGAACALTTDTLVLWRPEPRRAARLVITQNDGKEVRMTWPSTVATLVWPSEVPLQDSAVYEIAIDGARSAPLAPFILRVAEKPLESTLATLDWMVTAGCHGQVAAMLRELGSQHVFEGAADPAATIFNRNR
jgi:hypothetical protein